MSDYIIVVHGGAENKGRDEISPEKEAAYRAGIEKAMEAGWEILNANGSALDAVEAAVKCLEDVYLFNAGKGGAFDEEKGITFDAAIMDGNTLKAGAVAAVENIKNPIKLARKIHDESEHTFLAGDGAREFGEKHQLELRPEEYFKTHQQEEEYEKAMKEKAKEAPDKSIMMKDTVGAVALDKHGNLAAATSTGGLAGQHKGRVGDSPVIGAGVYANNDTCAVSCTGDGEGILKANVAFNIHALKKYKNLGLRDAATLACQDYKEKIDGDRNLIAVDRDGSIVFWFETKLMFRGSRKNEDPAYVAVWKGE
ncbi:isoaspartyl peptidase/L-asparaginase [Adhaeribacter sp. BT258]|uniref:Isoaspartyl peptidase/L-asparaginase n=1 Tax=Adhaeribacter terrigena TaxID=2793070 RepID=A0ABS1C6C2_9BACT|nr:isoaspartyl peptidase/L-asparaginase [Adhaeribacter terrigena]MBK0404781.1 isoaspartyl peptidase/L-asparaginase [Adhaeribacter terrigena]